jgi:erythronate-4-phosphate dehydrogenase
MKIALDQDIPGVRESFARHGEVITFDGRRLNSEVLHDVQVLIVRSITPVNSSLLKDTPVQFVGTTTIGTDHLDITWLDQNGIHRAAAPGCNADAAAQYTLAMILLACRRIGLESKLCSFGIVGHGNVGSRLHRLLKECGVNRVFVCDPPLAEQGKIGLCDMDEISRCNVISFHVPLTAGGTHATMGMVDDRFLRRLPPGTLLLNTSRGKITEGPALHRWLLSGNGYAALDVFPGEPAIDVALLGALTVATPHVAGHSLDGKLRGTMMVYRQFCDWLQAGQTCPDLLSNLQPRSLAKGMVTSVADAVLTVCPVERDDRELRKMTSLQPEAQPRYFDSLRHEYPERRDFAGWRLPPDIPANLANTLHSLGFH